jgi:hypothetical protein
LPSFSRKGYLGKIGFGKKNSYLDLIVLKVLDDSTSLSTSERGGVLKPQENAIASLNGQLTLWKKFTLGTEHALSVLSRDLNSDTLIEDKSNIWEELAAKYILEPRTSSTFRLAHKANITYQDRGQSYSVNYRRIEPEYTSLGRYYMRTDIEQLFAQTRFPLLNKKMNIVSRVGLERTDIDNQGHKQTKRLVGMLNWRWRINQDWNVGIQYSNFSQVQLMRDELRADTAYYRQVSNLAMVNVGRQIRAENTTHRIQLRTSFRDIQNADPPFDVFSSKYYQAGLTYSVSIKKIEADFNAGFNYLISEGGVLEFRQQRVNAGLYKSFFKIKVSTGISNIFTHRS